MEDKIISFESKWREFRANALRTLEHHDKSIMRVFESTFYAGALALVTLQQACAETNNGAAFELIIREVTLRFGQRLEQFEREHKAGQ